MVNCKYCKKSLVSIGNKRLNGKIGENDWKGRKYHKICYKIIKERYLLKEKISLLNKYYLDFD